MSNEDAKSLETFVSSDLGCPFGNNPRFSVLDHDAGDGKLGTYGFISGARDFIVGAVKEAPMSVEDYGYALEKIVLYATELYLGTCWLGGTFNRSGFAKAIDLGEDESIPAVTPVGYTSDRRLLGRLMRWGAGSKKRKPWDQLFFKPDMSPINTSEAEVHDEALELVRLGPSASNSQPWRLIVDGDAVHFFVKKRMGYGTMQRLDMGIAMCHFELAMNESGVNGKWLLDEPELSVGELGYVASWVT